MLGAAVESYIELENTQINATTHPYAFARLLAFEKHLQIELALTDAEFFRRPEWLFPITFFQSVCRVFTLCGESCYQEDIEWERSFGDAVECHHGQADAPPEVWIQCGMGLDASKKWEKAVGCYEQALEADGECVAAWSHRGNSLLQLGRLFGALESFDAALKLDCYYAKAWAGKGDVLVRLKRFDEAIEAFERFSEFASVELRVAAGPVTAYIGKLREISALDREARKLGMKVRIEGIGDIGRTDD